MGSSRELLCFESKDTGGRGLKKEACKNRGVHRVVKWSFCPTTSRACHPGERREKGERISERRKTAVRGPSWGQEGRNNKHHWG